MNNDLFPRHQSSVTGGSRRPTMASVGGGPRPNRAGRADRDAAALLEHDREPYFDEQRSAAIERYYEERFGRKVRLLGSAVAGASGFSWLNLQGPSDGYVWNVRRLNVGPIDYTTLPYTTGVTVIAVVGGQQAPPAGSVSADQVASVSTGWPAEATWGPGELTLEGGDYLWVGVAGLAQGTQITAGGQAQMTAVHTGEVYGLA